MCADLLVSPVSSNSSLYNAKNWFITFWLFIRDRPWSRLSGFLKVISGCLLRNPFYHFQPGPAVSLNRDFLELFLAIAHANALICATDKG